MKKIRIPPPIWMLICGASALFLNSLYPMSLGRSSERLLIAGVCLLLAAVFLANSLLGFIRNKTTVNPLRPEKATSLVMTGVYRFSRNPMYLGMLLCLCAWGFYLGNILTILGPVLFGVIMNALQISPEEQVLREKFGDAYLDYCSKVRRWL